MNALKGRDLQLDDSPPICRVLREDVGLAEVIPEAHRARAIEECIAAVAELAPGSWSGYSSEAPDGVGLLVLKGLLIRHVGVGLGYGAELLGEGDLLRPWQEQDAALPHTTGWRVLEPTRLAVLDRLAAERFARYPELTGPLVGRALERSRNLALNMAIVQQSRLQTRLHMLLWHLANRWGHVRPDGVILPLPLTHSVLSELVAARRPSVSVTLSEMAKVKLVRRVPEGWLLSGKQPGELLALRPPGPGPERQGPAAKSGYSPVSPNRASPGREVDSGESPPRTG